MNATANKASALLSLILAVSDAVKEAGTIPSGHLYAMLMTHGCNIQQYQSIERILTDSGRIVKRGDVLTWIG